MARITIGFDGSEYRVPGENGSEESAYYTDDRADAVDTAGVIHGDESEIIVRRCGGIYWLGDRS